MSLKTVEPGALLASRYRIDDLLNEFGVARAWRAHDTVLVRSVVVHVVPADDPVADRMLEAARRGATVTDARFLRVLDADVEGDLAYIVREWGHGQRLSVQLEGGPMPARRAGWIVREVAEAMAIAHEAGTYHGRISPANVVTTDSGAVKIKGLAVDAKLHGDDEPTEADDVRDLGRLLYALLVKRWPGGATNELPAAPVQHGRLLMPRQVRPGVPRAYDYVCHQLLAEHVQSHPLLGRNGSDDAPITSAAEASRVLTSVLGDRPGGPGPSIVATAQADRDDDGYDSTAVFARSTGTGYGTNSTVSVHDARPPAAIAAASKRPQPPSTESESWRPGRVLTAIAVAVLLAGFILLGIQFVDSARDADPLEGSAPDVPAAPQSGTVLDVAAVYDFDPQGDGTENGDQAGLAVDNDQATVWPTQSYTQADLGGLKEGVGLVLDLGEVREVGSVAITFAGEPTSVELRAAPAEAGAPPERADAYEVIATEAEAGSQVVLEPDNLIETRYVLVWLTGVPLTDEGSEFPYRGQIAEVAVRR